MRQISFLLLILLVLFSFKPVYAESNYVLPYPSAMPGSKLYLLHRVEERLLKFWYFGDFGQFLYARQLSDKYLVEAKTLFEYDQLFLGLEALRFSDDFFRQEVSIISNTRSDKNGIGDERLLFHLQAKKHRDVLAKIKTTLPDTFLWKEEHEAEKKLELGKEVENSIRLREKGQ